MNYSQSQPLKINVYENSTKPASISLDVLQNAAIADQQYIEKIKDQPDIESINRIKSNTSKEDYLTKQSVDMNYKQFLDFVQNKFVDMSFEEITKYLTQISESKDELNVVRIQSKETVLKDMPDVEHHPTLPNEKSSPVVPSSNLTKATAIYRASMVQTIDNKTKHVQIIPKFEQPPIAPNHNESHSQTASKLNIPRSPVACPISSCVHKLVFVSEFIKHIKINHVKVPFGSLIPGCFKNFFLDANINSFGENRCHLLYLVSNKIK